jgi:hypothetical protein
MKLLHIHPPTPVWKFRSKQYYTLDKSAKTEFLRHDKSAEDGLLHQIRSAAIL